MGNGTPAEATPEGLQNAAAFLDESHTARPSLVDVCARLVLGMLRDTSVVSEDGDEEVTLADAVLAGACELDVHLRGLLISTASVSGERLADRQVRALLEYADSSGSDTTASGTQPESQLETPSDASSNGDSEWDTDAVQPLTHLALAMHPNPLPLLRDAPHARLLALTSLDLAYATLPDLDRLVAVLPARLRALGLAGVRSRGGYDGWQRGLALMARKLILLQVRTIERFEQADTYRYRHWTLPVSPSTHRLLAAPCSRPPQPICPVCAPSAYEVSCSRSGKRSAPSSIADVPAGGSALHSRVAVACIIVHIIIITGFTG